MMCNSTAKEALDSQGTNRFCEAFMCRALQLMTSLPRSCCERGQKAHAPKAPGNSTPALQRRNTTSEMHDAPANLVKPHG